MDGMEGGGGVYIGKGRGRGEEGGRKDELLARIHTRKSAEIRIKVVADDSQEGAIDRLQQTELNVCWSVSICRQKQDGCRQLHTVPVILEFRKAGLSTSMSCLSTAACSSLKRDFEFTLNTLTMEPMNQGMIYIKWKNESTVSRRGKLVEAATTASIGAAHHLQEAVARSSRSSLQATTAAHYGRNYSSSSHSHISS
ncbi:hypothetical protein Taro_040967 [Colocasia esculenta]|uniref:Uncharacterized protein n=1 Tax=Colocasia esculenta TaxID=4460 RepID=A0A843WRZ7_COLES|nr:hypothetical protein [Colocasia esculenta]